MPIYEYKCLDCGKQIEKIQKASDEPLKVCEACGGELAKQWSLSGFQFKGDGWYVTDYAGKKNADPGSGGGKEGSESTDSANAASQPETKDAGKAESKPDKSSKEEK